MNFVRAHSLLLVYIAIMTTITLLLVLDARGAI
jgi:hypothetical protein